MDIHDIRLGQIGTMVTFSCSLKCKMCSTATPLLHLKGKALAYDRMVKSYDKFFELADFVGKFTLGGGEPLLLPELPQLVEHMIESHREKIGVLEIITNGTQMPSPELIETLKRYGDQIIVMVDHYGEHSPLASEVGAVLTDNGIPNRIRIYHGPDCHMNGWVDLGDYSLKHTTREEKAELMKKCAHVGEKMGICVADGLLFACGRAYTSLQLGLVKKELPDFVDIFDPTKTVEQLRQEMIDLINIEYTSACAYCNGLCLDSPRFMPAIQWSPEEIEDIKAGWPYINAG